jgi:hypothetical protein
VSSVCLTKSDECQPVDEEKYRLASGLGWTVTILGRHTDGPPVCTIAHSVILIYICYTALCSTQCLVMHTTRCQLTQEL